MRIYRKIYGLHAAEVQVSFKNKIYTSEDTWTDAFEPPTPNARIAPSGVKFEDFERFVMIIWVIPTEDEDELDRREAQANEATGDHLRS